MTSAILTRQLQQQLERRGARLAAMAVQRLAARLARRWQDIGDVTATAASVQLRGRSLRQRRQGTRTALPDAELLWPDINHGSQ